MRVSCRPIRPAALAALVLLIIGVFVLAVQPVAAAETTQNASGRYDTLVLRDLGGKQAALVQLIAEDGAFTERELWRSKKGAFDARKATFVAGDVDGNGIADGIVLYDLGGGRSRLLVYPSDGFTAKQATAWTSKPKAFARAKAKLAVGDLDHDGRDDLLALYDRGRSGVALYRFLSTGSQVHPVARLLGALRARLVEGAARRCRRDRRRPQRRPRALRRDRREGAAARLLGHRDQRSRSRPSGAAPTPPGAPASPRATSTATATATPCVCYRRPDNGGRLDVFLSSGKAFAGPHVWYEPGVTPVPTTSRFGVGDVTGDGRADALTAAAAGAQTRVTTWVSSGSAFAPEGLARGPLAVRQGESRGGAVRRLVVSDKAEPLNAASMRYLREVEADGTLAFAGETGQLARLQAGDVLLAAAESRVPRTVSAARSSRSANKDGEVVVETAQAELCDVIDQGEIGFHMRITADDLPDDGIRSPGVRIVRDETPPVTFVDASARTTPTASRSR